MVILGNTANQPPRSFTAMDVKKRQHKNSQSPPKNFNVNDLDDVLNDRQYQPVKNTKFRVNGQ
jgi:hypothetical protein